jgi:hypothetical protein
MNQSPRIQVRKLRGHWSWLCGWCGWIGARYSSQPDALVSAIEHCDTSRPWRWE